MKNAIYFDFAKCKCGYKTPIRPTTFPVGETDQIWREKDNAPVFVACIRCKNVSGYASHQLVSDLVNNGVAPYDHEGPMRVFQVKLSCDDVNCETPLQILAVRNADTSDEDLEKEKFGWKWNNLKCPLGHQILYPPFR
jgi:hypothetical protein